MSRRESYTTKELAEQFGVPQKVLDSWVNKKWIRGKKDKADRLFAHAPRFVRVPITELPVLRGLIAGLSPTEARAENQEVDKRVERVRRGFLA